MKRSLTNQRKQISNQLQQKYFGKTCGAKQVLQKPFIKFYQGQIAGLYDYVDFLSIMRKEFLDDSCFQEKIKNVIPRDCCSEIVFFFDRLITLMEEINEDELAILLEIARLEENCYTEFGVMSVKEKYL